MTVKEELTDLIVAMNTNSYELGRVVQYSKVADPPEQVVLAQQAKGLLSLITAQKNSILAYLGDDHEVQVP